jgi:hypothetical protein
VRGNNLSGVIRFTYNDGIQTTSTATLGGNAWMIFYEGQVFNGTTFVAINNGSLSGVLDESFDFPVTQNWSDSTSNSNTVPAGTISSSSSSSIQVTASSNPAGYFNGTIDNNSPNGAFSGKGELSYVIETDTTDSNSQSNTIDDTASSSSSTSTTTSVVSEKFKVKGVRITFGS